MIQIKTRMPHVAADGAGPIWDAWRKAATPNLPPLQSFGNEARRADPLEILKRKASQALTVAIGVPILVAWSLLILTMAAGGAAIRYAIENGDRPFKK